MLNIKAEKLTKEAFSLYGEYYEMTNPNGYSLNGELHCFFNSSSFCHNSTFFTGLFLLDVFHPLFFH